EQRIMKLPELLLVAGAQRRFGCLLRVRMNAVEREVPVDHPHILSVVRQYPLQRRIQACTEGTLEIGKLDDRYGGVRGAARRKTIGGDIDAVRLEEDFDIILAAKPFHERVVELLAPLLSQVDPHLPQRVIAAGR